MQNIREWKLRILDTKSSSFCGAKWYNSTIWLWHGKTASCHHNPYHDIDLEEIKTNPKALHNTLIKKQERVMMQQGQRPLNCQYCWVYEDLEPTNLADRVWLSSSSTDEELDYAFRADPTIDHNPQYLEIAFDKTCQMACSYCAPSISSTWSNDIKTNGPYINLKNDSRGSYTGLSYDTDILRFGDANPYIDAFFKWWSGDLSHRLKTLRITGGEPFMSGYFWKLLDILKNSQETKTEIIVNTNLSYDTEKLMRFLDYVDSINLDFSVATSGEAYGSKGEYVRDGLDWELFNKNFDILIDSGLIKNLSIMGIINAPALDGYMDFLHWLLDKKKRNKEITMAVTPVRWPTFQNIIVLPKELRNEYSDEIESFVNLDEVSKLFTIYDKEQIKQFIVYLRSAQVPHKEETVSHDLKNFNELEKTFNKESLAKDFKSFFTQYDSRRNKNFSQTFPRLADWYNNL